MKRTPRQPSKLSESLHRQLNSYALAASAAGVGMLSLGRSASAKVVYTPVHTWLPVGQSLYLDLNHDGVNDFRLVLQSHKSRYLFSYDLSVWPRSHTQQRNAIYSVASQNFACAAALPKGKDVGPKSPFLLPGALPMFVNASLTWTMWYFGPWMNVTRQAYLGLRFEIKGQVHYGWARLGHIRHKKPVRALLTGYAYESIPNKPIITGKTHGPDVIVKHATLGELAAGRK